MNDFDEVIDFIVQDSDDSPKIISSAVLASTPDNMDQQEYNVEDSDEGTEEYARWMLNFWGLSNEKAIRKSQIEGLAVSIAIFSSILDLLYNEW